MVLPKGKSLCGEDQGYTVNHLRDRIVAECHAITPNLVTNILRDMDNRLQTCFDLNGSHIEHIT
ncbi:hypothetical protein C0J52_23638 [Blattella germanica]|nr:hypothetical protein C0J52_23638 [Blattella germanica]